MSAYSVLGVFAKYLKAKKRADVSNTTFTLQRLTAGLLLALSALTASRQFFGEPIHCHLDHGAVSGKVFESYCWMSSTFTLVADTREDNATLLYGGVGRGTGRADSANLYHSYYQWVGLLLVLQAAASYGPWAVWKSAEGGRVGGLLAGLVRDPLTETPVEEQVSRLGDFLLSHRGWFNSRALKLLLCQAAAVLNALAQLYMMDLFLNRRFLRLGALAFDYSSLNQALKTVFPKVVMCSMELFGATGSHTVKSGICTLPINIVNEKIYLVLWFWFLALTVVSLLQLVRQAALLAPSLRTCLAPGLASSLASRRQVRQLVTRSSYGDTVLLQLIAANCDAAQSAALVRHLVMEQRQQLPTIQDYPAMVSGQKNRPGDNFFCRQEILPGGCGQS